VSFKASHGMNGESLVINTDEDSLTRSPKSIAEMLGDEGYCRQTKENFCSRILLKHEDLGSSNGSECRNINPVDLYFSPSPKAARAR
jgi:hypothetical protein